LQRLDTTQSTNYADPGQDRRRRGRPARQNNSQPRTDPENHAIQNMIEETVKRVMSNLRIKSQSNMGGSPLQPVPIPAQPMVSTSSLIKNWNIQLDGGPGGIKVEQFIYRVKILTDATTDNDFPATCKHLHILMTVQARDWFWRYHSQVSHVDWSNFCIALRLQYKDFTSDFVSKERIRSRNRRRKYFK